MSAATPVLIAVVVVVISGMAYTLWWGPVVNHSPAWVIPGDVWGTFRDAHIIGWGGEGILYSSNVQHLTGFVAPPAMPALLAPVAMLAGVLHLSESLPFTLARPSAWLLLGPAEMAVGALVLFPLDALGSRLGLSRGRRIALLSCETALVWPVVALWGHPEDVVALGLSIYALMAAKDSRWRRAAVLLGAGLAFQPLVFLLVPLAMSLVPWRRWAGFAAIAAVPCALLLMAPLVHTLGTTVRVLVDQPTYPSLNHPTPWIALARELQRATVIHAVVLRGSLASGLRLRAATEHTVAVVAGGPARLIALGVCIVLAALARRLELDERQLWWHVAVAFSVRCVFESVMAPYYVVPALAVAVAVASSTTRWRFVLGVGCAALCSYLAYRHAGTWSYYVPVTATMLMTVGTGSLAWGRASRVWIRGENEATVSPDPEPVPL